MSGANSDTPFVQSSSQRASRPVTLLLVAGIAVVGALLVASAIGSAAVAAPRGASAAAPIRVMVPPPADFALINLTANNTTVDVSMAFNLSVQVNLTGVIQNNTANNTASNFTFAWSGLPAFVPGDPGSGCAGFAGVAGNNSSVLNCTAASDTPLTITLVVTNWTNGETNSTGPLAIAVNPLPSISAFSVSQSKIPVNTAITFTVAASGGTGGLTYEYTGLPLGCASTAASFSCTPDRVGIYNVTVTAVDAYGFTSAVLWNVTVTVESTAKAPSGGIGTTGWGIVIGILVVGFLATGALLVQARREERAGQMGTEEPPQQPPTDSGTPPTPPPAGPSS